MIYRIYRIGARDIGEDLWALYIYTRVSKSEGYVGMQLRKKKLKMAQFYVQNFRTGDICLHEENFF